MTDNELPDSPFEPINDTGDETIGGEESLSDPSAGPVDRLFDGDAPGPEVNELKADYDMPQWLAVLSRGIMRVATGGGVPPIAEIIIGSVMGILGSDLDIGSSGDPDRSTSDAGDTSDGAPPGVKL